MALEQHLDIPVSEEPRKRLLSMAPAPRAEKPRSSRRAWVALALIVVAVAGAVGSQMIGNDAVVEDGSSEAAEQARFAQLNQQPIGDESSESAEQARFAQLNPNPVAGGSSDAAEQARFEQLNPNDS
jgi:hypothetical protein